MNYIAIASICMFYVFFFVRTILLKRKIGKSIKAQDPILNLSIFFAGLSSLLFVLQKSIISINAYLLVFSSSLLLELVGTVLIIIGLLISSIASSGRGNSWRIGVDEPEKTALITDGIYGISRNPYFLSYDIVLAGIVLSSLSILIFVTSIITMFLFHLLIIKEEKYLESVHGEEYTNYKSRVRRYL